MFGFDLWEIGAFFFIVIFYFVPTIVAHHRKHPKRTLIRVINLTTGWTVIGYLIALIWAYSYDPDDNTAE